MNSNTTNIYLLRHGLPEGDKCLRGLTDFAITEHGFSQMQQASDGLTIDAVISSPLKRCCHFAKTYADNKKLSFETMSDFAEMNFGDWDGKPFSELFEHHNSQIMAFFKSPYSVSPPNGETMVAFNQRVTTAFKFVCQQYQGKNLLLVSHAGVMREILQLVLGVKQSDGQFQQSIDLAYASLLKISVINDKGDYFYRLHL